MPCVEDLRFTNQPSTDTWSVQLRASNRLRGVHEVAMLVPYTSSESGEPVSLAMVLPVKIDEQQMPNEGPGKKCDVSRPQVVHVSMPSILRPHQLAIGHISCGSDHQLSPFNKRRYCSHSSQCSGVTPTGSGWYIIS